MQFKIIKNLKGILFLFLLIFPNKLYASFFEERLKRDKLYSKHNIKNSAKVYEKVCKNLKIKIFIAHNKVGEMRIIQSGFQLKFFIINSLEALKNFDNDGKQ